MLTSGQCPFWVAESTTYLCESISIKLQSEMSPESSCTDGRSSGHKHKPLSGLTTVISANAEDFSGESAEILSEVCSNNNCLILLLQETHRGPTRNRPKITGMNLIVERPHDQYGSAIFIKPGINLSTTSTSSNNNIEILSICIAD